MQSGVNEADEMALVFVVTTMMLENKLVKFPELTPPARPTRVIIEGRVRSPAELFA